MTVGGIREVLSKGFEVHLESGLLFVAGGAEGGGCDKG